MPCSFPVLLSFPFLRHKCHPGSNTLSCIAATRKPYSIFRASLHTTFSQLANHGDCETRRLPRAGPSLTVLHNGKPGFLDNRPPLLPTEKIEKPSGSRRLCRRSGFRRRLDRHDIQHSRRLDDDVFERTRVRRARPAVAHDGRYPEQNLNMSLLHTRVKRPPVEDTS